MAESDVGTTDTKCSRVNLEGLRGRKFKASDLPISASQRATVDSLLFSFKKKGGFDLTRKEIWARFNETEAKGIFTTSVNEMAESEIERDTSLLSRERGKAATLIEGAVDRSDLYKSVEAAIDDIFSSHLDSVLGSLRAIRHQEVGVDTALAEEKCGEITDEEYDRVIQEKRVQRERARLQELKIQEQREAEEAKTKAEELQRQRELRKKKEEESRRKDKEREEQRRAEKERARQEQRRLDGEWEKEREARYERRRREDNERYRDSMRAREDRDGREYDRDRTWRRDRDRDRGGENSSGTCKEDQVGKEFSHNECHASETHNKPSPPQLDEKSLEDAALELLLKEGKELAERSRQKPEFDFEAEALEDGRNHQTADTASKTLRMDQSQSRPISPSQKEQQNSSLDSGREKRKLSDDDRDGNRDYRRTDISSNPRSRPSRHNGSISHENRDPECRYKDGRDTGERVRDSHYSRSRSRSTGRGRKGRVEHRDRNSDSDGHKIKDVDELRDKGGKRDRDAARGQRTGFERGGEISDERQVRDRENDLDRNRDLAYDRDRERARNDDRSYRPRKFSRSRSRSNHRRRRSRPEARSRSRSLSRSRTRRSVRGEERSDSRARRRSGSQNVVEIDRYVPLTSNRSRSPKRRERERERDWDREDRARYHDIDRYMPGDNGNARQASTSNRDDQRSGRASRTR